MATGMRIWRGVHGCCLGSTEERGMLQLLPECLPHAWLGVWILTTPTSNDTEILAAGTPGLAQVDQSPKIFLDGGRGIADDIEEPTCSPPVSWDD
jgi:hypothetical protein